MPPFKKIEEFRKRLNNLGNLALDFIFPIECFGCGREGSWICGDCYQNLEFKEAQYCLGCKNENRFGEFCSACKQGYSLDGVLIAGDYENELLSAAIKHIKYHLVKSAARELGKYLAAFLVNEINKIKVNAVDLKAGRIWEKLQDTQNVPGLLFGLEEALIIPVPLHPRRERSRGFNQAEALGRVVADKLLLKLESGFLIRKLYKAPQAKLGEEERKRNIQGSFGWKGENLKGRSVVLIDDVVTTGSTLNECARVLKENGAGEVWGLVVAKG